MKLNETQAVQATALGDSGSYYSQRRDSGMGGVSDIGMLNALPSLAELTRKNVRAGDRAPTLTAIQQQMSKMKSLMSSRGVPSKGGIKAAVHDPRSAVAIASMQAAAADASRAKNLLAATKSAIARGDKRIAVGTAMKYVVTSNEATSRAALNEKSRLHARLAALASRYESDASYLEKQVAARQGQTGISADTSKMAAGAGQLREIAGKLRAEMLEIQAAPTTSTTNPARMADVASKFAQRNTIQNSDHNGSRQALLSVLKGVSGGDAVLGQDFNSALSFYGNDALGSFAANLEFQNWQGALQGLAGLEQNSAMHGLNNCGACGPKAPALSGLGSTSASGASCPVPSEWFPSDAQKLAWCDCMYTGAERDACHNAKDPVLGILHGGWTMQGKFFMSGAMEALKQGAAATTSLTKAGQALVSGQPASASGGTSGTSAGLLSPAQRKARDAAGYAAARARGGDEGTTYRDASGVIRTTNAENMSLYPPAGGSADGSIVGATSGTVTLPLIGTVSKTVAIGGGLLIVGGLFLAFRATR